ncbi:GNAT family N-acetyltransferase [Halomonas sp. HMF6819]|uniref:GNAT family N-acetyltransferase n=1 Tax=Halomonas sp. HMF6819 TaxID=3373085 RepID=UPI0037994961
MGYKEVCAGEVPLPLLLEADPSERSIASYRKNAWCFAVHSAGETIGACIVKPIGVKTAEIFNIAVCPPFQKQGIGSGLLSYTLGELKARNMQRVELNTGAFGYQLTYYQRHGFRVDRVLKNHFLEHYSEPIIENGLQHLDALRLYRVLD